MNKYLLSAATLAIALGVSGAASSADIRILGGGASAETISANVQTQRTKQTVNTKDEHIDGDYKGNMNFDAQTFTNQKIDSNNFATGINNTQQNGVSLSVNLRDPRGGQGPKPKNGNASFGKPIFGGTGAISANLLKQVSTQKIGATDETVNNTGTYNAEMKFGKETFRRQIGVANNFATGMNNAQQGGVSIAASLPTPQLR